MYYILDKDGNVVHKTALPQEVNWRMPEGGSVIHDNRHVPQVLGSIKAQALDVLDYFNANRKSFSGMSFSQAFGKLYRECKVILDIPTGDDEHVDELARAVDIALTIEQRRNLSYSSEDYYDIK